MTNDELRNVAIKELVGMISDANRKAMLQDLVKKEIERRWDDAIRMSMHEAVTALAKGEIAAFMSDDAVKKRLKEALLAAFERSIETIQKDAVEMIREKVKRGFW